MAATSYSKLFSGFRGEEGDLIPILQKTQKKSGFLSPEDVNHIARFLKISENWA